MIKEVNINNSSYDINETEKLDVVFNSYIPENIKLLKNLTFLKIRTNNGFNDIPAFIYELKNLTSLDLAYNQIRGEISHNIGKLKKLRTLNLSNNNLKGSIPESIGNLVNLINLDLFLSSFLYIKLPNII